MLADALTAFKEIKVLNTTFFNEFTVELPCDAASVVDKLAQKGIIAGYPVGNKLIVAATEMTSGEDIAAFAAALKGAIA